MANWQKDIPIEDYHHAAKYQQFFSSSDLKDFMRSPMHCHYNKFFPKPETPGMRFGTIFHAVALEPKTVAVAPELNMRTNAGKAAWETFCGLNKGKVIATKAENAQACAMVESIKKHRVAGSLLEAPGEIELSGFFDEPVFGIPGKLRCDKILPDDRIIIDLKSTTDASEEEFAKTIFNYGYDVSGAWYNLGAHQIDRKSYEVILIAVEKTPPYACNTFRLTEQHFAMAYMKIDSILDSLKKCIDTDYWPCYPQRLINPEIPHWGKRIYSNFVGA